jgi:hypothetical protein
VLTVAVKFEVLFMFVPHLKRTKKSNGGIGNQIKELVIAKRVGAQLQSLAFEIESPRCIKWVARGRAYQR